MNDFGFIDYQEPIGQKNDYRTSSYLGHLRQSDIHPNIEHSVAPNSSFTNEKHRGLPDQFTTEQSNFEWKVLYKILFF